MQIRLIDRSIQTTPGMLEFVHSHITAAVRRFASRVREIRVQIADVNGPKGGLDKRCVILATVSGGRGHVIARHRDSEFYATIAGAAHAQEVLKIGVNGVMSGEAASWGPVNKFCAETTADLYNAKVGVDIGFKNETTLVWQVIGSTDMRKGPLLVGDYGGVSAEASVALGVGANALVAEGKEIPDNVLAVGSPARVVREFTPDEIAMRAEWPMPETLAVKLFDWRDPSNI